MCRCYYEAYDDRYRQVHKENLMWFAQTPSQIVLETITELGINHTDKILELGCGEGRDAGYLMNHGYNLLATDVSQAAIEFCKARWSEYGNHFRVLDCVQGSLDGQYDFIYAVAVVHMLVEQDDRDGFYRFIYSHLKEHGAALICTMGDGELERCTDVTKAFDLQERVHEGSGKTLKIASTSYRAVSFETFKRELTGNGFRIRSLGVTDVQPDYFKMMYAIVEKS